MRVFAVLAVVFILLPAYSIVFGDGGWEPAQPLDIRLLNYEYDPISHNLTLLFEFVFPHPLYKISNTSIRQSTDECRIYFDIIAYTGPVIQVVKHVIYPIVVENVSSISGNYTVYVYVNDELKTVFELWIKNKVEIESTQNTKGSSESPITTTTQSVNNGSSETAETRSRELDTGSTGVGKRNYSIRNGLLMALGLIFILLIILGLIAYVKK